jgi:hypothetical protein
MLDARGQVRKDLYKPNGDVHLNVSGTKIASLRIRNMLEIMLPNLVQAHVPVQAPVQAPVAVPVVVHVPLVAAGVQQLVGQIQDLVVQNVTIVQPPVAMEVEGDNEILKRLFLQRFGRALPELEKRNEVDDINMDLIDLTKEDDDEMEVAAPAAVVVVKTESIETPETPEAPEAAPSDDRRRSSRLERRGLRKADVIQEKEAPLAAGTSVIADADTDMAEDTSVGSVNAVESVNSVESEPLTAAEAFEMAEAAIAESNAAIAANQMVIDKFYEV